MGIGKECEQKEIINCYYIFFLFSTTFYGLRDQIQFFYFFIFLHKDRERKIRTYDIRFIRRGSQPIELPLEYVKFNFSCRQMIKMDFFVHIF